MSYFFVLVREIVTSLSLGKVDIFKYSQFPIFHLTFFSLRKNQNKASLSSPDFYYIKMQNFQRLIWKADTIVYKITYAIIKFQAKPFYASAPIFEKNSHCIVNWWLIIIYYAYFIHMSDFTWILALNKIYCRKNKSLSLNFCILLICICFRCT